MNTLPALEEIENSAEFQAMPLDQKDVVYEGYFKSREEQASNEDDYNEILKYRADRKRSALQARYHSVFPEDTSLDIYKIKSAPDIEALYNDTDSLYSELDYNTNASRKEAKAFRADDMEDPTRGLSYKPYTYRGKKGYTVVYPNGDSESIPGIENESQLTEFFKTKRLGQFDGKREGFFDKLNPIGDSELDSISDKIRNTESSIASGIVGEARKGFSGIVQGVDTYNIESINRGLNRYREAESSISQLEPIINRLKKQKEEFPGRFTSGQRLSQLEFELQQAKDTLSNNKAGIGKSRVMEDLNPLSEGLSISPDEALPQLTEKYSQLASEIQSQKQIKGSRVLSDIDGYIQSQTSQGKDGMSSYFDFFKNNPSQVIPYVLATAASSAPDVAMMVTGSAAAGAVGGPATAAATAQALGYSREYTATLLSELQVRAAKEGKDLTDSKTMEGYLNDSQFMDQIKTKAKKRASVIGLADAVLGGVAESVARSARSAFRKVATTTAVSALTESTGELGAQIVAEDKINWRDVIDEGLGSLGAAGPAAVSAVYNSNKQSTAKSNLEGAKEEAKGKFRESLNNRVDSFKESVNPIVDKSEVVIPDNKDTFAPENKDTFIPDDKSTVDNQEVVPENKNDSQLTEESKDAPVFDSKNESLDNIDEQGPGFINKVLSFFDRNSNVDDAELAKFRIEKARQILSNDLDRSVLDILLKTDSFDRIMKEVSESGYDENTAGKLMDAIGLDPSDANKKVITNVLGNYWSAGHDMNSKTIEGTDHYKKGLLVAAAIDKKYRDAHGLTSYYDANKKELSNISPDTHILLNIAPDEIVEYEDVSSYTIQGNLASPIDPNHPGLSGPNQVKRFNKANQAQIIRNPKFDETLENKYLESKRLKRENIKTTNLSELNTEDSTEIANFLQRKYKGRYILKSVSGYSGQGINASIYKDNDSRPISEMVKVIEELKSARGLEDVYVENLVDPASNSKDTERKGFDEYRVHLFVDKNGQAHVFKNLTFNKKRSLYEQQRRASDSNSKEDALVIIPDNPNNPVIKQLQDYSEKMISGKKEFADTILGLDTAFINDNGKASPFIFEVNPVSLGMSGFLGNPIAMSEIFSEMTGRPSIMSGLYQLSKMGMTKEQLNSISSAVSARIDSPYKTDVNYQSAVDTGINTFNRYIPSSNWMEMMKNLFVNAPIDFLKKLYASISSVFNKTVDIKFAEDQGSSIGNTKTRFDTTPVRGSNLSSYIDKLFTSSQLTESQRQVLGHIKLQANENLLQTVSVKQTKSDRSYYDVNKGVVYIKNGASTKESVHEVIHSVTSDFIAVNSETLRTTLGFEQDNTSEIKSYYEAVKEENYDNLINSGISPDFINAAKVYLSLLNNIGITEITVNDSGSPVGSEKSSYEYQERNKNKIPYGAISMDEMMADALTNTKFQRQLSGMPAVFTNAKNMFDELIRLISRILRIPVNKDSLLFDAITSTLETIGSKDNYYLNNGKILNTEAIKPVDISEINGTPFKTDEVSNNTKASLAQSNSRIEDETLLKSAEQERTEKRFAKLKALYPNVLSNIEYNGSNLAQAREAAIAHLHEGIDQVDSEGNENTKRKKEAAAILVENKILAIDYLNTLINDPNISDNHADFIVDAMEHVMNETSDPTNMSTRRINYYNSVLESISDGGPPVGFKYILPKNFKDYYTSWILSMGSTNGNFSKPIGKWRGEPLFGRLKGDQGSTVGLASEIAYIGSSEQSRDFLSKFMGTFRDQIDRQQLEQQSVESEFYDHLKKMFPASKYSVVNKGSVPFTGGPSPLQALKIGLVARLTQYAKNSNKTPVDQLLDRYRQLTESIPIMEAFDKAQADLTRAALQQVIGSTDLSTVGNENDIISFLERGLSNEELSVLNKTRDIGKRYLPALKFVKAITKKAVIEEYVNYVHDTSVSPQESGEENILTVLNSMSDVLQDRQGIDPSKTFPILDIRAVAERQIQSSTYEKYTGIERYLLADSLDSSNSSIPSLLDANTDGSLPITNRLKKLIASAHNSMVRSQPQVGGFIGFAESLMNLVLGHAIVGVNAFVKNGVSSSVQRLGLSSLSIDAVKNMFVYDMNSNVLSKFIKENFPTQYNRTSEYDTLKNREARWNATSKFKTSKDLGDSTVSAIFKTLPHLPKSAVDLYSKRVLGFLSNVSNAIPEKRNAFAMWTAAYIHYGQENGTVKDSQDLLARLPVDKNAATRANDFVSRSLGYAPDKQSKGTFWNGSTATKQVLSKTFYVFRQQATGIAIEFQNAAVTASRLYKSGNYAEMNKSIAYASSLMLNSLAFRSLSLALGSAMIYGGLDRFFNANDDEEKKKKLLEAKRKYTASSVRNNTRDFLTETLMSFVPVATSSFAVEAAASWTLDNQKVVLESEANGIEVKSKRSLQDEVSDIDEQVKLLNKVIKEKELRGIDSEDEEDKIDQLELSKSQLTEMIKFRYFPNRPIKAFLSAFGAYGMTAEAVTNRIQAFTDSDLDTDEKRKLANMLDTEFTYNDPLAGSDYPWLMLRNGSDFIRNFTEFDKRPSERVPTELYWESMLKIGQNPSVVVERGRKAIAQDAVRARNKLEKKVDKLKKRYVR